VPSREFALALLREDHVAVAPGTAFGDHGEGYVRISLATATDLLYEGVDRLVARIGAVTGATA
jgi:aspartate/methionine/tyrosine aminotransferase